MIEDVVQGVVNAIDAEFPDVEDIYVEHIPQGFSKPSFFVQVLEPSQTAELDNRYHMTVPIRVHYFAAPDTNKLRQEAENVAERLYGVLEYIDVGGLKRGRRPSHRLSEDATLLFDITYTRRYERHTTVPAMGALKAGLGVKGTDGNEEH